MKRIPRAAALTAVLALMLTGCASSSVSEDSGTQNERAPRDHYSFVEKLPDGSEVLCIWAKSGSGAGLSCDWANRTEATE